MPHIRIENDYFRTQKFLEFIGRKESAVLLFLMAHIVRDAKEGTSSPGAVRMRKNYFDKGMLCASYSLGDIARYFGWGSDGKPNKSNASKIIKKLENMGLLKIHDEFTPLGRKNIYQLGYCKGVYGSDKYQEFLYFDKYFGSIIQEKKQKKLEKAERKRIKEKEMATKKELKKFQEPSTKVIKPNFPSFDLIEKDPAILVKYGYNPPEFEDNLDKDAWIEWVRIDWEEKNGIHV